MRKESIYLAIVFTYLHSPDLYVILRVCASPNIVAIHLMLGQTAGCTLGILPDPDLLSDGELHHAQGDVPVAVVHHLHELDVCTRGRHPGHEMVTENLV